VFEFTRFIIAKRFPDLSILAFELDSHAQIDIIKFFLRTSFVLILSYLELVAIKKVNFEFLDKQTFWLPD
jgi:hypothetical protein